MQENEPSQHNLKLDRKIRANLQCAIKVTNEFYGAVSNIYGRIGS